ncbi:intradiol ring-cleavage dioxygenase [soil metagenome]
MSRRTALTAIGGVGLGVLLAACERGDAGGPVTTAEVPTTTGGQATVQPQLPPDAGLAEVLDAAATCELAPQAIEGPFWFPPDAIRSDLREDREGVPLRLVVRVQDAECVPLPGAAVDVWSCDAVGLYSGFESVITGGGGPEEDQGTYLRGVQVTGEDGVAQFTTVYPGWYPGRAVHLHCKVHTDDQTVLTAQLYVDDAITDRVHEMPPYAARQGGRRTTNAEDVFFNTEGGDRTTLAMSEQPDGWLGAITLGVQAS